MFIDLFFMKDDGKFSILKQTDHSSIQGLRKELVKHLSKVCYTVMYMYMYNYANYF